MITDTVRHLRSEGQRVFVDCEHFFDGYRENPGYALEVVRTAAEAGAEVVVLCDTNGGMLPPWIGEIVRAVNETGVPLDRVETMYRRHPKPGPAGVLAACVLAAETKVPPEQFLENRTKGKGWVAQAREHNVPISRINDRLDNMLRFLDDPNKVERAKKDAQREKRKERNS